MKLQIQSIHFDTDQKLLDYLQKKCDKLDHFYDRIIDAQVYLKLEKVGDPSLKKVEIKVNVPGDELISKEQAYTFEEAIDLTTENLKRQIKRHKEKFRSY